MSEHSETGDIAPGEPGGHSVLTYSAGLALAVLTTGASFYMAGSTLVWGPAIPAALVAMAIAQIGVHLVFFLHIDTGPDNTNNTLALAFGVLIVFLVVAGSVWIMSHLNGNMMPMGQLMQMQH